MAKEIELLVPKDSETHETYFEAFVDGRTLQLATHDIFGNVHETSVMVWSVEHAGDKTRFGLKETRQAVR